MLTIIIAPDRSHLRTAVLHQRAKIGEGFLFKEIGIFVESLVGHADLRRSESKSGCSSRLYHFCRGQCSVVKFATAGRGGCIQDLRMDVVSTPVAWRKISGNSSVRKARRFCAVHAMR